MSYGLDWWIVSMPTRDQLEEHFAGVCAGCGIEKSAFRIETEEGCHNIHIRLRREQLLAVRNAYGDDNGWTLEDCLADMDRPSIQHLVPEDGWYELFFWIADVSDDVDPPIPPQVVTTERFANNSIGWVALELLAVKLVERLGLHPDDNDRDDESLLWSVPPVVVSSKTHRSD